MLPALSVSPEQSSFETPPPWSRSPRRWLDYGLVGDGQEAFLGWAHAPAAVRQLPVKGRAPWNGRLVLLEDLLTLQAIGALRGRASGQRHPGGGGHPVPRGVSPEGRLVLAGRMR